MHAVDSVCLSRNKGTEKVEPCFAPARLFCSKPCRSVDTRAKPPDPLLPLGSLVESPCRSDRSVRRSNVDQRDPFGKISDCRDNSVHLASQRCSILCSRMSAGLMPWDRVKLHQVAYNKPSRAFLHFPSPKNAPDSLIKAYHFQAQRTSSNHSECLFAPPAASSLTRVCADSHAQGSYVADFSYRQIGALSV
jgi:hypothetical protein